MKIRAIERPECEETELERFSAWGEIESEGESSQPSREFKRITRQIERPPEDYGDSMGDRASNHSPCVEDRDKCVTEHGSRVKLNHEQEENGRNDIDLELAASSPRDQEKDNSIPQNYSMARLVLKQNVKVIERRKTIFSVMFTNKRLSKWMIAFFRNRSVSVLMSILWFICTINCLSICFRKQLIPSVTYLPVQTFGCMGFFIHHSIFVRVDVVKELIKSFNFWFTVYHVTSFHICLMLLFGSSLANVIATFHSFYSLILLLVLYDAHAAKHLFQMNATMLIGIFTYTPILAILLLRMVHFDYEILYSETIGIEMMDVRLQALDNLATIVIYLFRIFFTHVVMKQPTKIAFLSSYYEIDKNMIHAPVEIKNNLDGNSNNHRDKSDERLNSVSPGNDKNRPQKPLTLGEVHAIRGQDENGAGRGSNDIEVDNTRNEQAHDINKLDPEKYLKIGIMETKVMEYDPRNTIFYRILIKKYPRIAKILKSKYYHAFGFSLATLSPVVSFIFSIWKDFGIELEYVSAVISLMGVLFMVVQIVTTSNIFLVGYMIYSFDSCYVVFLIIKVVISSGVLCEWDIRIIFWIFCTFTMIWCIMIDTLHAKSRYSSNFSIVGCLWSLTGAVLCKLSIGDTFSSDRDIHIPGIEPISARITLFTSLFSVCVFAFRFFWSYRKNKNRIFFIAENITVEYVK